MTAARHPLSRPSAGSKAPAADATPRFDAERALDEALGRRLRAARVARRWPAKTLAGAAGLSRDAVLNYETGRAALAVSRLVLVATTLGLDAAEELRAALAEVGR